MDPEIGKSVDRSMALAAVHDDARGMRHLVNEIRRSHYACPSCHRPSAEMGIRQEPRDSTAVPKAWGDMGIEMESLAWPCGAESRREELDEVVT